jgi:hypothetical protein
MSIVFRLEHIGSTYLAATTVLGANLGQVSLLFVLREEPRLFLIGKKKKMNQRERRTDKRRTSSLVIEALVGTENHSATRQAFFHSSLVSFLFPTSHILEAVRAFDDTIRAAVFVVAQILAEDRSFAILTIRNLKLAFLPKANEKTKCETT